MKFDGLHLLSVAIGIVLGMWVIPWLLSMMKR